MATPEEARAWLERFNAEEAKNPIEWQNAFFQRCTICRIAMDEGEGVTINGMRFCTATQPPCIVKAQERNLI